MKSPSLLVEIAFLISYPWIQVDTNESNWWFTSLHNYHLLSMHIFVNSLSFTLKAAEITAMIVFFWLLAPDF